MWYVSRMKSRHNRAMKQMEKVRSNFFTNVTHEFRTPLTVILGLLEQLQKGGMNREELQRVLKRSAGKDRVCWIWSISCWKSQKSDRRSESRSGAQGM